MFCIFSCNYWLASASLKLWMRSVILPVYNHGFLQCEMLSFACSHAFMFYKEAGYCAPTFSFLSIYISLFLSLVHRQAVSAEAGTMSTPTNPEVKELSPVDFIQLQQYIECEYRVSRRAGRQLSQRLTPPLHFHFHPHTLIYTHSFSYLEEVAVCHILFFSNKACISFVFYR